MTKKQINKEERFIDCIITCRGAGFKPGEDVLRMGITYKSNNLLDHLHSCKSEYRELFLQIPVTENGICIPHDTSKGKSLIFYNREYFDYSGRELTKNIYVHGKLNFYGIGDDASHSTHIILKYISGFKGEDDRSLYLASIWNDYSRLEDNKHEFLKLIIDAFKLNWDKRHPFWHSDEYRGITCKERIKSSLDETIIKTLRTCKPPETTDLSLEISNTETTEWTIPRCDQPVWTRRQNTDYSYE